MDFKIIIGSKVVRSERIGYQQQGFTQQIQAENINLSVCVSLEKFVSMMKREYDQYVSEVKDMWANKTEQDDDDPLCQAGWPGFRQVVEDQNLLGFVIKECLHFRFLELVASSEEPEWIIHCIDDIAVVQGVVEVRCGAHSSPI